MTKSTETPTLNDDEDVPRSTMPLEANFCMRGFASEEEAHKLGRPLWRTVHEIGRYIDLQRLDGVTVGCDYDDALASVDRGIEGLRPLSRSDGDVVGIAMSPAVLRDGVVKVHLVFGAGYLNGLAAEDQSDDLKFAVSVVAHECAHVEVIRLWDEAFPGTVLRTRYDDYESAIFGEIAEICWEEYAACRIAAPFSFGKSGDYAKGLVKVLDVAREKSNAAIRAYRDHGDIDQVVNEAGSPLCAPLKLASYLLGQLDGSGRDWSVEAEARTSLETAGYATIVDRMHQHLRDLWEARGNWKSQAQFQPLRDIARSTFAAGGLHFEAGSTATSGYVRIPYTAETMPS
jgi:hypothetical protein